MQRNPEAVIQTAATATSANRALTAFGADKNGGIAIMFALSAFLLFGTVGGAIDIAQAYRAKTMMQSALDSAVLAAARVKQTGGSSGAAIDAANAYLRPVKDQLSLSGSANFRMSDADTAVIGIADFRSPVAFLAVMGFDGLSVTGASKASFGVGSASATDVELVMMLDVTGSMAGSKIDDLKLAAEDMIEIVVAENQDLAKSRVGLAPFGSSVKLDTKSFREATGKDNSGKGSYKGCVVERTGTDAYTDAAPGTGGFVRPLEDVDDRKACDDGREVYPLTSKKSELKAMIRSLSTGGTTAGHLGTAWAWYMLSPNWASLFDSENRPEGYEKLSERTTSGEKKLRKIAVLMTDGEYNTSYSAVSSDDQAKAICAEMKKTGIEVFTVGFALGDSPTAIDTLRSCASDASKFYNTTTGEDLRRAFRDIALQASPLRLTR